MIGLPWTRQNLTATRPRLHWPESIPPQPAHALGAHWLHPATVVADPKVDAVPASHVTFSPTPESSAALLSLTRCPSFIAQKQVDILPAPMPQLHSPPGRRRRSRPRLVLKLISELPAR